MRLDLVNRSDQTGCVARLRLPKEVHATMDWDGENRRDELQRDVVTDRRVHEE